VRTEDQIKGVIAGLREQSLEFSANLEIVRFCNGQIVILRWVLDDIEFDEIEGIFKDVYK